MTSNTDGTAQGEWRVEVGHLHASIGEVVDFPDFYKNGKWVNPFDVVDELNADHRKAQMADSLAKALENIANELTHDPGYAQLARDVAEDTARAALAQFHAATEEATR